MVVVGSSEPAKMPELLEDVPGVDIEVSDGLKVSGVVDEGVMVLVLVLLLELTDPPPLDPPPLLEPPMHPSLLVSHCAPGGQRYDSNKEPIHVTLCTANGSVVPVP